MSVVGTEKQDIGKQETVSEDQSDAPQLAIHHLFGVLGVAFYLAWGISALQSPLLFQTISLVMLPIAVKEIFLISALIMTMIIWALAFFEKFSQTTVVLFTTVAVLTSVAPLFDILGASNVIIILFWIISGCGTTVLLMFWGSYLAKLDHRRAVLYPALSFVFMAVLLILTDLFSERVASLVITFFPIISFVMLFLERATRSSSGIGPLHEEFLDSGHKLSPKNSALLRSVLGTFRNNVCLGFAIYYFFILKSYDGVLFFGLVILGICAIRVIDLFAKEFINMDSLGRIITPLAALSILPLSFVNSTAAFALCCFTLAYSALTYMTNLSAVSENARTNGIDTPLIFCSDRVGILIGLAAGLYFGFLAFGANASESADGSFIPSIVVIIVACLHPIIFSGNNSYQFTVNGKQRTVETEQTQNHYGFWRYRCMQFAEYYHLSPRQQEVMLLLVKGRDANYIEESLVISGHTAKAHIYNIYSKTNVHSRQELIDLIETFEISDRED